MVDFDTGVVIYCALVGLFFLGLWLAYDCRDHRRFEGERRKTTFHCVRCDHIYAITGRVECGRCPHCGHENPRLKF